MEWRHIFFSVLLFTVYSINAAGQSTVSGLPFITEYSYKDYHNHGKTWATLQTSEGDMLFAHEKGVLIYDGHGWQLLQLPGQSGARSLFQHNGIAYVGGFNQAGCLVTGSKGEYRYIPLIPDSIDFRAAEDLVVQDSIIFLLSPGKLIMHDLVTNQIFVNKHDNKSRFLKISDKWHVIIEGKGVYALQPGFFYDFPPATAMQGKDWQLTASAPFQGTASVVYDKQHGFMRLNIQDYSLNRWANQLDTLTNFATPEKALRLSDGTYLFIVPGTGLFVAGGNGTLKSFIDNAGDLLANTIFNAFEDQRGNLWLNTNRGILYVEYNSPFRVIDHRHGLEGSPVFTTICCNSLITGTSSGVYILQKKHISDKHYRFHPLNQKSSPVTAQPLGSHLLVSYHDSSLLFPSGKKVLPFGVNSFHRPSYDTSQLWAGTNNGLMRITIQEGPWSYKPVKGISGIISKVHSTSPNSLWTEKNGAQVSRLLLNPRADSVLTQEPASSFSLMGPHPQARLFNRNAKPVIAGKAGFFTWDDSNNQLYPVSPLNEYLPPQPLDLLRQDSKKRFWFWKNETTAFGGVIGDFFNGVTLDTTLFKRLARQHIMDIDFHKGKTIFTANDKLIVYNPDNYNPQKPLKVKLSHIFDVDDDTLIRMNPHHHKQKQLVLLPDANDLRFVATTDLYTATGQTQFAFKLEGHDKNWNPWQNNHFKEYTDLKSGTYVIHVKSRDFHGYTSTAESYTIEIQAPWYAAPIAFAGYGIVLLALVFIMVEHLKKVNKKKTLHLEKLIKSRTQELIAQKKKIRTERDNINDLNTTKDKFFSIIAHDLRSPFNSLLGLSEILKEDFDNLSDEEKKEMIESLHKSASLSFSLLDNLLTWSRTQRKKVEIYPGYYSTEAVVKETLHLLDSSAKAKNIKINNFIKEAHNAYFDRNMALTILRNLISNAIKFTHPGGLIEIDIEEDASQIRLSVKDNGVGMSDKDLQSLFDPGKQIKRKGTQNEVGTGLGLILCNDFAQQNNGKLKVRSEYNKGSTFTLCLPKQPKAE